MPVWFGGRKPPSTNGRLLKKAAGIPTLVEPSAIQRILAIGADGEKPHGISSYGPNRPPSAPNLLNLPVPDIPGVSGTIGASCSRGASGPFGKNGRTGAGVTPKSERGAGKVRIVPDCGPRWGVEN